MRTQWDPYHGVLGQTGNPITGALRREKGARCVELVEVRGPLRSLPRRHQGILTTVVCVVVFPASSGMSP